MTRKERYDYILSYFRQREPNVTTELQFGSAFQLLCATLLSAQCTDKRINEVTPALFAKYPTPELMAKASVDDVLEYVRSVSYPNAKSRHLVEMSRMLVEQFGGVIPDDPKELVKLPGVGRKTANVLQAVWFGKATMAVDTHVYRVSHRLGLVPKTSNTSQSRGLLDDTYSRNRCSRCAPLVAPSRAICVPECPTEMREMPVRKLLPQTVRR